MVATEVRFLQGEQKNNDMRKIDKDIRIVEERYKFWRERLKYLYELRDASDFEDSVRPDMKNVLYYGAYYKGVRDALDKIRAANVFKDAKINDAVLRLASRSVTDADRWMSEQYPVILTVSERDRKGNPKRMEASWGERVTVTRKIE